MKHKAFTLIELVVVIVILGLLAAVAAFAYSRFTTDARSFAIDTTVTQFSRAYNASLASGSTPQVALADASNGLGSGSSASALSSPALTRTNMIVNPSFETNTNTLSGSMTYALTNSSLTGERAVAATHNTTNAFHGAIMYGVINATGSQAYTGSIYVKANSVNKRPYYFGVEWRNSSGTIVGGVSTDFVPADSWQRVSFTTVAPATAVNGTLVVYPTASGNVGDSILFDGVMAEQSSVLGSYFDGSFSNATWLGVANGSASRLSNVANPVAWVNITHENQTWCVGLPTTVGKFSKPTLVDYNTNPQPGDFKKGACV